MQDQPEPIEEEQEQVPEGRQQEEEEMRYPGHSDPEGARERDPQGDEEIHDA
jgi:hypothetical protein